MIKNLIKIENKEEIIKAISQIVLAILVAIIFRSFFYQPYQIPSGSMKPTLLVGDRVFISNHEYGINRYSLPYGIYLLPESRLLEFSKPQIGDIVVFRGPKNPYIVYIKRLIGLPGDKIQMISGILYLNGKRVDRKEDGFFYDVDDKRNARKYIETLPNGVSYNIIEKYDNSRYDNTDVYTVPEKSYFLLGDNRDESLDSRAQNKDAIGFVHEKYLIGKAKIVYFSSRSDVFTLWKFFTDINLSRSFIFLEPSKEKK